MSEWSRTHLCNCKSGGEWMSGRALPPMADFSGMPTASLLQGQLPRAQPFPSLSMSLSCLACLLQETLPQVQSPKIVQLLKPITQRHLDFPHCFQHMKAKPSGVCCFAHPHNLHTHTHTHSKGRERDLRILPPLLWERSLGSAIFFRLS